MTFYLPQEYSKILSGSTPAPWNNWSLNSDTCQNTSKINVFKWVSECLGLASH